MTGPSSGIETVSGACSCLSFSQTNSLNTGIEIPHRHVWPCYEVTFLFVRHYLDRERVNVRLRFVRVLSAFVMLNEVKHLANGFS
jgi:hypothetical protein